MFPSHLSCCSQRRGETPRPGFDGTLAAVRRRGSHACTTSTASSATVVVFIVRIVHERISIVGSRCGCQSCQPLHGAHNSRDLAYCYSHLLQELLMP